MSRKKTKKSTIFVQIASYRDPELIPTIQDMLSKAKHPNNLRFGICWQYDESEDTTIFDDNKYFKIEKIHYTLSEGLGWARAITNSLYDGEEYTLQIDSHHRFVQDWDEILLEDFNQALQYSDKPIITTYCTPFDPTEPPESWEPMPSLMSQYEFSYDKLLMSMPWYIQDYKKRTQVIRARTLSGHFYFTYGKFVNEVPYDPDIYFGGYTEETTMSVRAYTHGYDFFSPYRTVMWHEYSRSYRVKHWDDHGLESETKKTSGERDVIARDKTRQLFGQEEHDIDMGIYALGNVRTLHDYEVYGGFDFKNCKIHDYTLKVKEPPNPLPWEEGFVMKEYKNIICLWDTTILGNHIKTGELDFIALGIEAKGESLARTDFLPDDHPEIFDLTKNFHKFTFKSDTPPERWVLFPHFKNGEWGTRQEGKL
jgi:hypothetical protein